MSRSKTSDLNVDLKSRDSHHSIVHLQDIDCETTEEEVIETVKRVAGEDEEFKLTSLRPAYDDTKSATIITTYGIAKKLMAQRIRIGWVHIRARIRELENRCLDAGP